MSDNRKFPDDALRVVVESSETTTHYKHDGEQYGSWSESRDFSILGAKVVDENYKTGYDEEGYRVPADTTQVYILYMTYSTGDSFGHCDGCGAVLGCFGKRETAIAAKEAVEKQQDEFSITIKDDFDREITIYNPGAGYFESIWNIDLEVKLV